MGHLISGRSFPSYYDILYNKKTPQHFEVYVPGQDWSLQEAKEGVRSEFNNRLGHCVQITGGRTIEDVPIRPLVLNWESPWWETRLVAFDVETTSFDPKTGRIVEIAFSEYSQEQKGFQEAVSFLVNDGVVIPEDAVAVHGISNEMIADAPPFDELLPEIEHFFQSSVLISHNRGFDMGFLMHSLKRAKRNIHMPPCVCSMELSIATDLGQPKHRLGVVAEHLGLDGVNSHRAADDAQLCGNVFLALARKNPKFLKFNLKQMVNFFDNTLAENDGYFGF